MSNLPCELLDHIVDLLHDCQISIKNCCLVSKSWVAPARRHLFADVHFQTTKSLELWKQAFPDPSSSPARYTKTLFIHHSQVVTAADGEAGCWVGGFPRLACLVMVGGSSGLRRFAAGWGNTFTLLHGISPVVRSFRVHSVLLQSSRLFNLILSFPLLEDLSVTDCCQFPPEFGEGSDAQPSSLPAFSGSLELNMTGGMEPIARRLLFPSDGMHFRKLTLESSCEEDIPLIMELVEKCSHTLESLYITHNNLDHILVHLWESHSVRTNVTWTRGRLEGDLGNYVGRLLPEMTKRGMVTIDLTE